MYLSINEIRGIIKSLKVSTQTTNLNKTIKTILQKLDELSEFNDALLGWRLNEKGVDSFLVLSKEILELSIDLNEQHIVMLISLLEQRRISTEESIFVNNMTLLFLLLLITAVTYYFYRLQRLNRIKEQHIENINNELDKVVLFSRSDLDGNITHISSALLELSGYVREEIIGNNHRIFKSFREPLKTTS